MKIRTEKRQMMTKKVKGSSHIPHPTHHIFPLWLTIVNQPKKFNEGG
jgi:hypothetical protein